MALVDPYSPCPCGSGQKYKWCCQKVEAYAERAQRLVDNGQYESALKPLDEGLAKVPANPWLSTRKALVQLQLNQFDAAKLTLRELLQSHPDNLVGIDPADAAGAAKPRARSRGPPSSSKPCRLVPAATRAQLASLASLVGAALGQAGFYAAALKHLELAGQLAADELQAKRVIDPKPQDEPGGFRSGRRIPTVSGRPPTTRPQPFRESFERALGWANEGSGRPRRRRSSCWPPVPGPVRSPIAIGACVACGSPITKAPSPRCGDISHARARRSTQSTSRPCARRSNAARPTIKSSSFT